MDELVELGYVVDETQWKSVSPHLEDDPLWTRTH